MPTKIVIKNNGSIKVEGDFELFDQDGNKFDLAGRTAISLCRCGHSNDKPFCDRTHRAVGFSAPVVARTLPPPAPKT
ncbi:MAG TPA: CDGSH iron-sulfur domain-containing protein [Bacteroidota bacterium]